MKVLSLFDGMACGMIAMQLSGVEVESYDAYEIDKYAIKTAQHNFPMIKEHGDVFSADFTQYEGVDFLIGGSPCTYWSIAQTKNRETVASGMGWELFSQYVRALHESKPKYFIYENNKSMSKDIRASIDKAFGFGAVLINSALVSAQNRQRLYWVGKRNADGTYSRVNVEQPADRGILLKDVLDSAVARDLTCNDKSYTLTATYDGACAWNTIERHQRNMVAEPVRGMENDTKSRTLTANYWKTNVRDAFVDCAGGRTMAAEPINVTADGKARTIIAQYGAKQGLLNSIGASGFGCTGVAEPVTINTTEDGKKARTLMAGYYKYGTATLITNKGFTGGTTAVADPVCVAEPGRMHCGQPQHYEARTDGKTNTLTSVEKDNRVAEPVKVGYVGNGGQGNRVYSVNGKAVARTAQSGGIGSNTGLYAVPYDCDVVITENSIRCQRRDQKHSTVQGSHVNFDDGKSQTLSPSHIPNVIESKSGKTRQVYEVRNGLITIKGKQYPIKLADGYYIIRKLTVRECMRLQTVPEWYEFPVSNSQAYKMLGNGWTCEVIAHILKSLKEA